MKQELRQAINEYFKEEFVGSIVKGLKTGHKLSKFNINPFALIALSSGVLGEPSSINMAKALLYPRVFGTSISTTFGDRMQKLCTTYLGARASATPGLDIEFEDKVDGNTIMMQLKAGPNTINKGDVAPILAEMDKAHRLLVQNRTAKGKMPVFAIGITYGSISEISSHYKAIATKWIGSQMNVPIYIGQDFWNRLTGDPDFYNEMINIFIGLFEKEDYSALLEDDASRLSKEIEKKYFTHGKLDISKI